MLVCLAGAVLLRSGAAPWQPLDDRWLATVVASVPLTAPSELLARMLAALVGPPGWALVAVVTALLLWRRGWVAALLVPVATAFTMLVTELVKAWVGRERPTQMLMALTSEAYPSGHTSQTAAFAAALLVVARPTTRRHWWPVAVLAVAAMAWSRTYLGVHWLSDTIAGAALGVGIALLLSLLVPTSARREPGPEAAPSSGR